MSVSIKVSFVGEHKQEILDLLRKFAADNTIRVDIEELPATEMEDNEETNVVASKDDQLCDQPEEPQAQVLVPKEIAANVKRWLTTNNVGQVLFANKVLDRAQSTFSDSIRNAPETVPLGHGKKLWEQMDKFLSDPQQRKELLMLSNKRKYFLLVSLCRFYNRY